MGVDLNWRRFAIGYKKMPDEVRRLKAEVDTCIKETRRLSALLDEATDDINAKCPLIRRAGGD